MKKVFFFIFLLFSIQSFGRVEMSFYIKDLPKQPAENRLNYLFAIEYTWQKESFRYKCIDSLKQIAKDLKDETLAQYSQLLWHEYNIYLAKNATEKAKYFEAAETFAKDSKIPELEAHLYYTIGIYDFYLKKTQTGLPLVLQAKKKLEAINYTTFRHAGYYYLGFFDLHYYFEDFKNAIKYEQLALEAKHNLFYYPENYYNNIGICYRRTKDYDNALKYFQIALKYTQKRGDKNFQALIEGNIGGVYLGQKQYKQALPYFYKDYETNKSEIPENSIYALYYIAECLLQLDSVKKAEKYIFVKEDKRPIWEYPGHNQQKFKLKALYYEKTGNFAKAFQYKDSIIALKDSLKIIYDVKKMKDFESQQEAEKFLAKKEALEYEIDRQKLVRNGIVFILSILFITAFLVAYYRYKKEKQIQLQKQKLADEQLSNANQQLDLFLNNIKEKNDLIEQMTAELKLANEQNPELVAQTQMYLETLQKSVILTEENWKDFKQIFEKIHPHYFEKLMKEFPEISPAETRLVALQKLSLPTKEMANMLGISADSIKKTRYRLRKKYPELLVEKHLELQED